MTKSTMRRALILLAVGGAAFAFPFGNFLPVNGAPACVTNGNLVGFYQTLGTEGINAFEDATTTAATTLFGANSDFEKIVIEPVATIWRSAYNNWVAQQFPLDVGTGPWVQ